MDDYSKVQEALSFIPANPDRDTWVKIGTAIKSGLGDHGFDLFDGFSAQADSYKLKDIQTQWDSFETGKVNIGTLFYYARKEGYKGEHKPSQVIKTIIRDNKSDKKAIDKSLAWFKKNEREYQQGSNNYADHKYLIKKLGKYVPVKVNGLRVYQNNLIYPLYNIDGEIKAYQRIWIDKQGKTQKRYAGKTSGLFFVIGRPIKNSLKSNDEIGIGEGLTTCLSGYSAGIKTVIVALDSGNLPKVAKAIKAKYPAINLIGLCDNDESFAGEKACKEAGIPYVIPNFSAFKSDKSKPTDFNDLHKMAGIKEVIRQLSGTKYCYQKYIDHRMIKPTGISLIKSDMGTGKTTGTNNLIKTLPEKATVLVCSHLISLTDKSSHDLNTCLYNEMVEGIWSPVKENDNPYRMSSTIHSLWKFQSKKLDVLVIDEPESLWRALCYSPFLKGERERALTALILLIKNAKKVIFIDAHLSNITTKFLDAINAKYDLIINKYKPMQDAKLNLYAVNQREQLRFNMQKKLIDWGKNIAYATSGKNNLINTLMPQIKRKSDKEGKNLKLESFTADTPKEERKSILERASGDTNRNLKDVNFFAYTSAAGVGISFDETNHSMDEWCGSFCTDVTTAREIHQAMPRFRGLNQFSVCVDSAKKSYETNRNKLEQTIFRDRPEISAELIGFDRSTGDCHVKDDLLMNLFLDVSIADNMAKNDPLAAIEAMAIDAGMTVNHVETMEGAAVLQRQADKEQAEIIKKQFDADVDSGNSENESLAILKDKVERMYQPKSESELNELTKKEHHTSYSSRIKPLLYTQTPLDTFKALDKAECLQGYSPIDLSHHTAKAKFTKKILSIGAGIDEAGCDNQKFSVQTDSIKSLKTFIRNNKKGLSTFNFMNESDRINDKLAIDLVTKIVRNIDPNLLQKKQVMRKKKRFIEYSINADLLAEMSSHAANYRNYFEAKNTVKYTHNNYEKIPDKSVKPSEYADLKQKQDYYATPLYKLSSVRSSNVMAGNEVFSR